MEAKQILDFLLGEFKTDIPGLAELLGVHKTTLGHISSGHTKRVSNNIAKKVMELKPEIKYEFLRGLDEEPKKESADSKVRKDSIYIDTSGTDKLYLDQIVEFFVNNIDEFEKNEVFRLYKNAVRNEAKAEAFEEQAKFLKLSSEKK